MAAQAFTNFGTGNPVGGNLPTSYVAADGFAGSPAVPFNPNSPSFQAAYMVAGVGYNTQGLAATGSTQGTAAAITSTMVTITSATAGTQFGAILPASVAGVGQDLIIVNATAVAIAIYPATGGSINGLATNVPIYLPANSSMEVFSTQTPNVWSAQIGAAFQTPVGYTTSTSAVSFTATGPNIYAGLVETDFLLSGTLTGAANVTLPTVATLVTQMQTLIGEATTGSTFKLRIINASSGAFAWTVVTNSGWTLAGTMSIAQNTWRDFIVTFTGAAAATLQSVGTGTYS